MCCRTNLSLSIVQSSSAHIPYNTVSHALTLGKQTFPSGSALAPMFLHNHTLLSQVGQPWTQMYSCLLSGNTLVLVTVYCFIARGGLLDHNRCCSEGLRNCYSQDRQGVSNMLLTSIPKLMVIFHSLWVWWGRREYYVGCINSHDPKQANCHTPTYPSDSACTSQYISAIVVYTSYRTVSRQGQLANLGIVSLRHM